MRLGTNLGCAGALVLTLGCQGEISGAGGAPVTGLPGSAGAGALPMNGPSDEELREKNPALFEVALSYFPGQSAAPGKPRLFRLTRQQLDLTTADLFPGLEHATALATLPRDPLQTNYEYADNLGFGAASFTPLTQWVDGVAQSILAEPSRVIDCPSTDTPCLDGAAQAFVRRAFRGVVSESQLARFSAFFRASVTELGLAQATADLVNVVLTSPGYVFRDEVQTDASGRLLPAQLLQNLSYTLADAPPAAVGLTLPATTESISEQELEHAARQVLETPLARAKLLRFFSSWLELKEPQDFDISTQVFPEFTPEVAAAVVDDTRRFLEVQLSRATPTLRDVTEAGELVVSEPSAFLYGTGAGNVRLDPAQRLGIFSLPAVIASHSGPTTTRLVKRGVFFTRKVMCLPLGVPPAGVDTSVPEDAGQTERERIENVTKPASCTGCHAFINPFGFMQEAYDPLGRYRSEDEGKPVDTSISVEFLDEGPFSARTPVEALRGFTRSLRFKQCFTRQLFRFYSGRDEAAGDDPLLRQLFFELAQDEAHGIPQLLLRLASSTSANARREAP